MSVIPPLENILDKIDDPGVRAELEAHIQRHILEFENVNQRLKNEIAEHKEAVSALRASESKYRAIFEGVSDLLFFHDLEGRITDVNPALVDASGYEADAIRGKSIKEMLPDDLATGLQAYLDAVKADGRAEGLTRILDKSGNKHVIEFKTSVIREASGKPVGVRGSARDVTEELRAKSALKQSELRLSALLDAVTETAILFDLRGTILAANEIAARRLGRSPEELKGLCIFDLLPPGLAALRRSAFNRVIKTGKPVRMEDSRSGRLYDSHWFPIADQEGAVKQVAVFATDITEARRAENERIRAEKLESMRMMAAGIAHDFNNLLTGVLGFLELALTTASPDTTIREHVEKAKKTCRRTIELTRRFQTLSRDLKPFRQPGSLEAVLRDYTSLALAGTQVPVKLRMDKGLWTVAFDEVQIAEVLTAVLTNAKESMSPGGSVEVIVQNCVISPETGPPASQGAGGRYVRMEIKDQGQGISEEHLPKLFDPYFSTKARGVQKGMGLGLATTYSIVKNHGGFIDVNSVAGEGTSVGIYLPAVSGGGADQGFALAPGLPEEETLGLGTGVAPRKRILVMDDEEMILDILEQMLTLAGYDPAVSRNGEAAIALYKEGKTSGNPFDAVILDLTVRGGMGGRETLEAMLKIDPQVKALVSSGYVEDPAMQEYDQFGFAAAVPKPYDFNNLKKILEGVLG